VRDRSRRI